MKTKSPLRVSVFFLMGNVKPVICTFMTFDLSQQRLKEKGRKNQLLLLHQCACLNITFVKSVTVFLLCKLYTFYQFSQHLIFSHFFQIIFSRSFQRLLKTLFECLRCRFVLYCLFVLCGTILLHCNSCR